MKSYIVTVTNQSGTSAFIGAVDFAHALQIQIQYRGMGFTTSIEGN